ncbi:MAG: hypothetical protein JNG84_13290 [Archangium sp.]|nr:hypothetical protein [Archangium sp.]
MPSLLTSLTAVERLSAHSTSLPPEFAKALGDDLQYARFGAALPELPWFGGWALGLDAWSRRARAPHFTALLHGTAPVAFGVKAAELVSNGALVGVDAGLAFLAGYFTQLGIARALEPMVSALIVAHRKPGETELAARHRIEWAQALLLMQDLHGSPMVGTSAIKAKLQIRKERGAQGVGRGLYELVRVSSQEAFGEAPTKPDVDGWMRGLYFFSMALASPLGRFTASTDGSTREFYRGPNVDFFAALDRGLEHTREVLALLGSMIRRNSFTARSKQRFLELCPEGPLAASAAPVPAPVVVGAVTAQ